MRLSVHFRDLGITEDHEFSKIPLTEDTWAAYVKGELRKFKVLTVSGSFDENGKPQPVLVTVETLK